MRVRSIFAAVYLVLLSASFAAAQTVQGVVRDRPDTTVDARIVFSPPGYDFTSYLRQLTDRIKPRWQSAIRPGNPPGRVVVWMNIERDGATKNVRVTQSSGITSFDSVAVNAINASKAFPSLPADFSGTQLTIELEFTHVLVGFDPKPVARPAPPR